MDRRIHPVFESATDPGAANRIDEFVFARLKQLGIQPANPCSDAVFVRRAFLDVTGTVPSADEAWRFITDRSPDKRGALIDRLLGTDECADYLAMKWGDLLRIKAEFPINLWPNAAQAYHRWVRTAVRDNLPYDRFARELLKSSGSNFRVGPVNFYRALQSRDPQAIAQAVALTFMGTRAADPHLHEFFSHIAYKETREWKEEIVFFEPKGLPREAMLPDGTRVRLTGDRDPREVFADWLTDKKNPWFARNIVNRMWAWTMGQGLIDRYSDVLAFLERELIASGYNLKHVQRLILNSRTYQLSCIPRSQHPDAAAMFAYYPARRLEAEVLIDAICRITGTTEKYTSAIPEPFTVMPDDQRATALPDGSTTSSFLELFGRPPRDTGLESERNNRITAAQRLHLLNSSHIQRKIEYGPNLQRLARTSGNGRALANGLYLTILSRRPTEAELTAAGAYAQSAGLKPRETFVDLAWALINSKEFLYRH